MPLKIACDVEGKNRHLVWKGAYVIIVENTIDLRKKQKRKGKREEENGGV